MAIAYKSNATAATGLTGASISLTLPSGIAAGDVILIPLSHYVSTSTDATITGPSGWTKIASAFDLSAFNGNIIHGELWGKVATGTESSTSLAWSFSDASGNAEVAAFVYSGASGWADAIVTTEGTSQVTAHSISITTAASGWLFTAYCSRNGESWTAQSTRTARLASTYIRVGATVGCASLLQQDSNASLATGTYIETGTTSTASSTAVMFAARLVPAGTAALTATLSATATGTAARQSAPRLSRTAASSASAAATRSVSATLHAFMAPAVATLARAIRVSRTAASFTSASAVTPSSKTAAAAVTSGVSLDVHGGVGVPVSQTLANYAITTTALVQRNASSATPIGLTLTAAARNSRRAVAQVATGFIFAISAAVIPPKAARLRHRSRHLRATIVNKLRHDLKELGWITPPVNFASQPITLIDYQPDERNEPILTNTVAVSLGNVVNDVDEEVGTAVGGRRSAFYPVFIDVYMAEQALSDAICDDLRSIFDAAAFPLINQITGLDSGLEIEIEQLIGPERPHAATSEEFKRYWRVIKLGVRLYYQT